MSDSIIPSSEGAVPTDPSTNSQTHEQTSHQGSPSPDIAPAKSPSPSAEASAREIVEAAGLGELPLPPGSRYLLTGGGTGGHVYPAIAIADEIKRRDPTAKFLYVGVKGKSESTIVPRRGYPLKYVTSEGFPGGKQPVALARFGLKLLLGILKSLYILMTFRPRLIIGAGGYVSAPIMLAALVLRRLKLFNARTFIHEQNTFPGKLNRLVGSLVDVVGVSFVETLKYFPKTGIYVGYPVRRELGVADPEQARKLLGVPPGKKVIFAFGGSQGARTINRAIIEALPYFRTRSDLFIIHGCGTYKGPGYDAVGDSQARLKALNLGDTRDFYLQQDYFHNIEQAYAIADLVICRGGAGTLTEIAARGIPALIIPKANLPGDHQVKNARALANAGAGRVIYERVDEVREGGIEEHVSGELLVQVACELLNDPQTLAHMRASARHFYRGESLSRIGNTLAWLLDPSRPRPASETMAQAAHPAVDFEDLGPVALVTHLERRERRNEGPVPDRDLEYLQYRTDDYLASPSWQTRNRAVKLVGLLRYQERLPHLLFMLKDRRKAHWTQRLMGGDFEQVGFIRRNIFESLRRLNRPDAEVFAAIENGLTDSYFEVRSQAAMTAAHFAGSLGSSHNQIVALLRNLLKEDNFEVVVAACQALGKLSNDGALIEDYRRFLFHKNWKIRQAVVQSLGMLLERGVISPRQVTEYMEELLITSNGFQPHFPLKQELQKLGKLMAQPRPEVQAPTRSPEDDA